MLQVLAGVLVLLGLVNVYFVFHSLRLYLAVQPPSPLLRAVFGVKLAIWAIGVYVGIVAFRFLLALPPLPFNGVGLGLAILVLELLPFFIWTQIHSFVTEQDLRNKARDRKRDAARDPVRDAAHDEAAEVDG